MKVRVEEQKRKAGLLGGKVEWQTTMTITASEEEKAIIADGVIGGFRVLEISPFDKADPQEYTIDELLSKPLVVTTVTKWHANQAAQKMKGAASTIKTSIEETLLDETGDFEL
ncbi:MAG: hypothetical protein AAFY38_10395 [Pseudomonadota bacterium]